MLKQVLIRKEVQGTWEEFKFPFKIRKAFVKNLSPEETYVSFSNDEDQESAFKILSNTGEEICYNQLNPEYFQELYVLGQGEVEIQALEW